MAKVLKAIATAATKEGSRGTSGLAGFNFSDLADEGRRQIETCRQTARQIVTDAEREADRIRAEAEESGYQEGIRRGSNEIDQKIADSAEQRAKEQLALLRNATEKMFASYQNWMEQYGRNLHMTALAAAERIIGRETNADPEILVAWAKAALEHTRSATRLTLAVHPETLAELGGRLDELLDSADLPEDTRLEPDESLARTDVVVRQSGGAIEAGLKSQLQRLEEMLA